MYSLVRYRSHINRYPAYNGIRQSIEHSPVYKGLGCISTDHLKAAIPNQFPALTGTLRNTAAFEAVYFNFHLIMVSIAYWTAAHTRWSGTAVTRKFPSQIKTLLSLASLRLAGNLYGT